MLHSHIIKHTCYVTRSIRHMFIRIIKIQDESNKRITLFPSTRLSMNERTN
jgi:hypothetical protein